MTISNLWYQTPQYGWAARGDNCRRDGPSAFRERNSRLDAAPRWRGKRTTLRSAS
jgi:hypothetical protein